MTDPGALLERLRALDVRVSLNGDRLAVDAPRGTLTPALRDELAAHREALRAHLARHAPATGAPDALPRVERTAAMRVAHNQRRLWFLRQLDPDSHAYVVSYTVQLRGPLDVDALEAAIGDLVARHESLRTRFFDEQGEPRCTIVPHATPSVERVDASAASAPDRDLQADEVVRRTVRRPFDLGRAPLMRAAVVRLAPDVHRLCLAFDHIVSDGTSIAIFLHELAQAYGRRVGLPGPAPSPLPHDYADLVEWEHRQLEGGSLARHLEHWSRVLADVPDVLPLPTDRPRPPTPSGRGARTDVLLPAATLERVRALARGAGTTPFTVMLAAVDTLLARWSGTTDIVVGTPVANRNREEAAGVFGFFVNNVVLRTDLSGAPSFGELLARVREVASAAFAHQEMPFDLLVERFARSRTIDRSPLFQVMFAYHRLALEAAGLPGLDATMVDTPPDTARFDLAIDAYERRDGIWVGLEYSTDLFDDATARRMTASLVTLLDAALADPSTPIDRLPLLGASERHRLLVEPNRTAAPRDPDRLLPAAVVDQARRAPGRVAVTCRGASIDYGELERRTAAIARRLRAGGVPRGGFVGVMMERSEWLPIALLGVLRAGAAYVPIDPAFPAARVAGMIEDSGLTTLLADAACEARAPAGVRVLRVEEAAGPCGPGADEALPAPRPEDPAYAIYTSGSTGRPKGVVVPHGALANFVLSMAREPGLTQDDVVAAVTTVSFDIAVLELLLPLTTGARVEVLSREVAVDPVALGASLRDAGATVLQATPATWRMLVEAGWRGTPGLRALCGGEALPRDLADALLERVAQVWNLYGPTETTVWSTCDRVAAGERTVPIGRPIDNTAVYVVDAHGEPVPVGVPGELWIGGDGVALGYHGRPELTDERFLPDRFAGRGRLYRTGDLARWRDDGRLEHLGRIDQQVKVRGFRIEPGEVEAALLADPSVRDAVVVARELRPGEAALVAYVVPADPSAPLPAGLRDGLRTRLPEYMLPERLVALDRLPTTPNGKVDRNALPAPATAAADARPPSRPPEGPTQTAIAAIWSDVVGVEPIGRDDDFIGIGGHSLLATRVLARVRDAFGVAPTLATLFTHRTLHAFAAEVDAAVRADRRVAPLPPIERIAHDGPVPLSPFQETMWLAQVVNPEGSAYNVPAAVRLRGRLDVRALEAAIDRIRERHESLRTRVRSEGDAPVQEVVPFVPRPLRIVDLGGTDDAAAAAIAGVHADSRVPFDLAAGDPMRCTLRRIADDDHVLSIVVHHAFVDQWSMGRIGQELAAFYSEALEGRSASPAGPALRYRDYAAWQRALTTEAALAADLEHWAARLAGVPSLALPTDRPYPTLRKQAGAVRQVALEPALVGAVRALCGREGCTTFMGLLALYVAFLHRLTGQVDVAVAVPVANRRVAELEPIVGTFVNTLVMRVVVEPGGSFVDLLHRVREVALDAFARQDVPFQRLVPRVGHGTAAGRQPLAQVMFNLQSAPMRPIELAGTDAELIVPDRHGAQFELSFVVDLQLTGSLIVEYDTDLFDATTIDRFVDRFVELGVAAVADPSGPVGVLPAASRAELAAILGPWNDTARDHPRDATFARLFERTVARRGDAIALQAGERRWTYRDLDRAATSIARRLRTAGAGPGTRVAVCMRRSDAMVAVLLAVQKAGAAYVPLDPDFPVERLAYMLADSGARALVTDGVAPAGLAPPPDVAIVVVESMDDAADDGDPVQSAASATDPVYVLYTSGSTGRPKGVVVPNGALVNFLCSMRDAPGLDESDVLAAVTTISFDIAGLELYLPLLVGARIVLVDRETAIDGTRLAHLLESSGATVLQATPATWRTLVEAGWRGGPRFRALCGGEPLPRELAASLASRTGELWNLYGPTETTIWSTLERVEPGSAAISIGRPIANTRVYVVAADGALAPVGSPGEIWIGGDGVAIGYHGRPELTAERFVPDPFTGVAGARAYRTGDLGRWLSDGRLEHLGRMDHQVKVRGYRIELGEIEAALETHDGVLQAVATVREPRPGDVRLVAFVVPRGPKPPDAAALRDHARRTLPEYMVPQHVEPIERIPLTPNGKVDRNALPALAQGEDGAREARADVPMTTEQRRVAALWSEVLGRERVGLHANFFDLGGHSMLLVRLQGELQRAFGRSIPLVELFQRTTVAAQAARFTETGRVDPALARARARAAKQTRR